MKLKINNAILKIAVAMLTLFLSIAYAVELSAQSGAAGPEKRISGLVQDQAGQALVGATIVLGPTGRGTITDQNGRFVIDAKEGDVLTVSSIGYATLDVSVGQSVNLDIVLQEDVMDLEGVVVVGYGVQKKATLTGAVVAVNSDDILKTKNENVQNMLTGKLPGLRVVQRSAEPGNYDMRFDIRGLGEPLIVIDGVPRDNLSRIDPNDVESISILKDASAAIYGVKAANGVVLVTTKGGSGATADKTTLSYSSNFTWQYTSGLPKNVGAVDFILMSNEKGMNASTGGQWRFTQEELDAYLSGEKTGSDWFDAVIKQGALQMQHNLNISGGSKNTNYYVSLGYQYQDSFLKSNDLYYDKYNIRANSTSKITRDLTMEVRLSGIMDMKNSPAKSTREVIYNLWRQYPTDPIYANNTYPYYYNPGQKENPVALMEKDNVGYEELERKWFQSSVSLQYNAPFLKGLSAKGQFSYDYDQTLIKRYAKTHYYYTYDEVLDEYSATIKNAPNTLQRNFRENKSLLFQLSLSYTNQFAAAHNVNAILLTEGRTREGDGFYASREFSVDVDELFAGNPFNQVGSMNPGDRYRYANQSVVGRVNYDYKGKYMLEAAFRYDGSSRFPASNRWGFFPSASVGYRMSEEGFWRNNDFLSRIENLKIRASYGVMGDDVALDYQFLAGYLYPDDGYFYEGIYVNGVNSIGIPNYNITWYQAKTANIGVDADAWRGLLGVSFDVYRRNRTGLLATSEKILPGTVGADLPQENLNSDKTFGYEVELRHRNHIGHLRYGVRANVSLTRSMVTYEQKAAYRSYWDNWKNNTNNRYKNIWWGLGGGGQYHTYAEIAQAPTHVSWTKIPGEYYYRDWNGDGFIDGDDEYPIGFNSTPLLNYGINIDASYKGFDINLLFQGTALSNVAYTEQLYEPFWAGLSAPLEMFLDRWRPVDPKADVFDQRTQWISGKYPMPGSATPNDKSLLNAHNGRYLRLKNIELGYTLNAVSFLKKIGIQDLRVYVNAYNLLTWSPLDFVDPEHPSDNSGYMYPLNRTVSVGLNCKF